MTIDLEGMRAAADLAELHERLHAELRAAEKAPGFSHDSTPEEFRAAQRREIEAEEALRAKLPSLDDQIDTFTAALRQVPALLDYVERLKEGLTYFAARADEREAMAARSMSDDTPSTVRLGRLRQARSLIQETNNG